MRGKYTIVVFLLIGNLVVAQNGVECEKLLKEKVDFLQISNSLKLEAQIKQFNHCFLDSIDTQIIWNSTFLSMYIVELISNENDNGNNTFDGFLKFFKKFKESSEYSEFRKKIELSSKILTKKAFKKNWQEDRNLLEELGLPEININEIEKEVNELEEGSVTYQYIIKRIESRKSKLKDDPKTSGFAPPEKNDWSPEESYLSQTKGFIYDQELINSKEKNKPLLLYFTGYGCINARRMELTVLEKPEIKKIILDNFLFFPLLIDDKTPLEKEDVTSNGITLRNVGHKYAHIQVNKFQSNSQPFTVIVGVNGEIIDQVGFVDIETFKAFLKKGMQHK